MISLLFFACVCYFFFLLDFSGNAGNGGSDIVRWGGLTMDKREIAHLLPLSFVFVGAFVGFAGAVTFSLGLCRGANTT